MPVASPSVVLPLRAAMELVTLEDILIEAVRLRPSIYDKTAAVYKNNKVREQEWKEVAQAVDMQDVEAVKKRWRSLRDSFIKIQRSLRHNPRQIIKWLYYKRMKFLVPHIETKELGPGSDASAKTFPDETTQETVQADSESESGGNRDDHRCSSDDVPPPDTKSDFKKSKRATDEDSMTAKDVDPLLPTIKDVDPQRRFLAGAMRKRKRKAMPKEFAQLSSKHSDPDEQFLLSCLPALKRMTPRENATARMRIQQILFEVEFSTSQEQQFLTKEEDID